MNLRLVFKCHGLKIIWNMKKRKIIKIIKNMKNTHEGVLLLPNRAKHKNNLEVKNKDSSWKETLQNKHKQIINCSYQQYFQSFLHFHKLSETIFWFCFLHLAHVWQDIPLSSTEKKWWYMNIITKCFNPSTFFVSFMVVNIKFLSLLLTQLQTFLYHYWVMRLTCTAQPITPSQISSQ